MVGLGTTYRGSCMHIVQSNLDRREIASADMLLHGTKDDPRRWNIVDPPAKLTSLSRCMCWLLRFTAERSRDLLWLKAYRPVSEAATVCRSRAPKLVSNFDMIGIKHGRVAVARLYASSACAQHTIKTW